MGVYVYAITSGEHPLRLDGVTGVGDPPEEVRAIAADDLVAVVSDAPEGLRAKRRDLLAHQAVLEGLMSDGSLLPLQFGAVAADDDAVRQILRERAESYRERLAALEGCAEFNLKGSCEEEALLRDILEKSDQARGLNEDIRAGRGGQDARIALGELVAAEVQARRQAYSGQVQEALEPLARQARPADPAGDDFVNVSFLVAKDRIDEFTSAEAELEKRFGETFGFRLNGPLPPFSFV
ncbi:GvpL/GvpF family gas vesicle protein [Actinacidiphila glaucinigra]|uniref:GvpL/GvpF family gas vesicle protein n=1 Tax=Actinacidiphila glaucinigra TaxID=235986 RepID=UPI0033B8DF8A